MGKYYPEVAVGALTFNPFGKLFLMRSPKWNEKYVIPGGHIEFGEPIEITLPREIKEETNMDIYDMVFLGIQEAVSDPDYYQNKHFVFLNYSCKTDTPEEQIKLNSEGSEFIFIYPEESLELSLAQPTRRTIENYLIKKQG